MEEGGGGGEMIVLLLLCLLQLLEPSSSSSACYSPGNRFIPATNFMRSSSDPALGREVTGNLGTVSSPSQARSTVRSVLFLDFASRTSSRLCVCIQSSRSEAHRLRGSYQILSS